VRVQDQVDKAVEIQFGKAFSDEARAAAAEARKKDVQDKASAHAKLLRDTESKSTATTGSMHPAYAHGMATVREGQAASGDRNWAKTPEGKQKIEEATSKYPGSEHVVRLGAHDAHTLNIPGRGR